MSARELVQILAGKALLTRADLTIRWGITQRRLSQIRQEDPAFPHPTYVHGPRWTPAEIAAYESRQKHAKT